MVIKWCGGVMILLGSVCIGMWFRMQYLHRIFTVKEMQKAITLLKGEIHYGRTPLPEACLSVAHRIQGSGRQFFCRIGQQLQQGEGTVEKIWQDTMIEVLGHKQLNMTDYEELMRLGNTLGYLDVELQVRTLELCLARLQDSIAGYEKEKKDQTRLYPVLGTFAGFLLCLVLV